MLNSYDEMKKYSTELKEDLKANYPIDVMEIIKKKKVLMEV